MKVKALKLFGDGKRLYEEGEIVDMTKEECELLNSTPNAPLLEIVIEQKPSKGVDTGGSSNNTRASESKAGNKRNS